MSLVGCSNSNFGLFFRYQRLSVPIVAMLFTACTAIPIDEGRNQLANELRTTMSECAANQAVVAEQLTAQQALLEQQQDNIKSLERSVKDVLAPAKLKDESKPVKRSTTACPPAESGSSKLLVGQLEKVWLPNLELELQARIDTGAETASLDARNIEVFERNGRRWVRFEIANSASGEVLKLERKLKRMVTILQSNSADSERRPVIKLGITIGDINQTAEFTLSNREHLDSQMLIGRNVLQDVMVVDVSKQNVTSYSTSKAASGNGGKKR